MGNENNNLGFEIIASFLEGVTGNDMSELRKSIDSTADSVIEEVRKAAKSAPKNVSSYHGGYTEGTYTRQRQEKLYRERQERLERQKMASRQRAEQMANRKRNAPSKSKSNVKVTELGFPLERVGGTSSILCAVSGGIGLGVSGVGILTSIPGIILGTASVGGVCVAGALAAIFAMVLKKGVDDQRNLQLTERCAAFIGKREYVEIKVLADFLGKSEKQTLKMVKKMLKKGFFPQGHLDEAEKNLILTDAVYKQYIETKKNSYEDSVVDTTAREISDEDDGLSEDERKELNQMISEGNGYILKLHELNDKIPGEIITAKLNRLEGLLKEIFTRVKEHPEQMSKMHELMEYYLPTMLKLVTAYEEYDRISEPSESIKEAKTDIEATLDTINDAFKKLLNNLFKESVWDVTTDAQVLKTVLAQKGLTNN